ncbi:replication-relaxation family protein [Robertmurraya sp. DFI.2.37]|uniref:replication-relaxation family protein n=1 Tax=Robertmurraya sp. DFI.2.37 TaxID=3031819 RepID=UPI0017867FBC|nr:replication-relaxation family protein [Robertmurraya sp. DFI.2.37]MDF1511360.1 replication-relaxation family protein [Robertmurraya sp. DFI.2.37]
MTRSQLQAVHNLKGDRNANRFLNDMSQYLCSYRHGLENVYYLSKEGRERIKCEVIRKKTPNIQHFLLRNQLWIYLKCPSSWQNEIKVNVGDTSIICDAKYNMNGVPVFVEVDISQPMNVNKRKIDKYKRMKELTNEPFHLAWVTEIGSRRPKLIELCEGLSGRVFTFNEII